MLWIAGSMMMAQSLRTRRQGSSSAPLVSRASNAHRTSDDSEFQIQIQIQKPWFKKDLSVLTTAIIQRTGPRFEPTNPTIQKANGIQKHLKSEDNTSEVEALMNPIPPREDADSHFSKPEVQNVYRFLSGLRVPAITKRASISDNNYACLYDPKKRAFPQIVHNVPCLKVLQRYERASESHSSYVCFLFFFQRLAAFSLNPPPRKDSKSWLRYRKVRRLRRSLKLCQEERRWKEGNWRRKGKMSNRSNFMKKTFLQFHSFLFCFDSEIYFNTFV